jgi:nucleoid-associated protein YgaU
MEEQLSKLLKNFKLNENTISTILGGVVLVVVGALVFNYFNANKTGQITSEAVVDTNPTGTATPKPEDVQLVEENGKMVPKGLPTTYKVAKGDDLWHIAEKFYKSGYNYVDIARENKITNPSAISEGTELTIPKVEARKETYVASNTDTKVAQSIPSIEGTSYEVTKGDSLWNIAIGAYGDGYAWNRIYQANKDIVGKNPGKITAGMKLTIPR